MALTTLAEIRSNIQATTNETGSASLINNFINLTGLEIHNFHPWTWLREKQTFATVASQENYNLDSEVDRIAFMRELDTPRVIQYMPDELFYKFVADPENQTTDIPRIYRLWQETGFATNLAAADTVYVSSDSASDTSSFNVRIVGRNSSGERVAETLTLNGTASVTSTNTYAADGLMYVSKSAVTTGTITVYRTTGATSLAELEPDNLAPRYKRLSFYPIPASAYTIYYEYYKRYRYLSADTDVPQMDTKWNWVLREGALSKMWEWKQNDNATSLHLARFRQGLNEMKRQDSENLDYVATLQPWFSRVPTLIRTNDQLGFALNP